MNKIFFLPWCLFFFLSCGVKKEKMMVGDYAGVFNKSETFTLFINDIEVPVYRFDPMNNRHRVDFSWFICEGKRDLKVKYKEAIDSFSIKPLTKRMEGKVKNNELAFHADSSDYVYITINESHSLIVLMDSGKYPKPDWQDSSVYNVRDFITCSENDLTLQIQEALDFVSLKKGMLYFPPGIYKSKKIKPKSNTRIYLDQGAVLYAEDNPRNYENYDSGVRIKENFIEIVSQENVSIEGYGLIIANGIKLALAGNPPTPKPWVHGDIENVELRIHAVYMENSTNVAVKDILVMESTDWAVTFFNCDKVLVDHVKVINYSDWFWSDGIHLTSCRDGLVTNSFAHCGDDTFVATTRIPNAPSKNIIFRNNVAGFTTCSAFRAGWYAYDTMDRVIFENNLAISAGRGIDLVHYGYYGKPISNVVFRNIIVENINDDGGRWQNRCPIFFDIRKHARDKEQGKPGMVENVLVENYRCLSWGPLPSLIKSYDSTAYFNNITFNNIEIAGKKIMTAEEGNIEINKWTRYVKFEN